MRRGHEVELLFTEKRLDRPQFEIRRGAYEGLPYHEVVYNRHFHDIADLYDDPRMAAPIGAVLDAAKPDVLHVQSLVYLGLALLREAQRRRIPIAMTLHEYFASCPRSGLLLDLDGNLCDPIVPATCARCIAPYPIERERYPDPPGGPAATDGSDLRFFARAIEVRKRRVFAALDLVDRFVAPSAFLKQRLVKEGLPSDRIAVADYGFPAMSRAERAPRTGALRLGFVGTLADYKGVHVAVDAMALLEPGVATLAIRGEPSWFQDYTGPLRQRAGGIAGVAFDGPLPPGDLPRFLAGVDALIVPSLWYENSPLTMHEAFQAGVPVLASDLGGMAELLASGGGLTFRRGDATDLARIVAELASDRTRLDALAASAPPVKSIERNAEEMESLFRELADL